MDHFEESTVLVVGGAGFVGGNLVRKILSTTKNVKVEVIDNLLSAERFAVPQDCRVTFTEGSISDDAIVNQLGDDYDFIFHLATFHGNQSSIHDPLKDHENNTLTTLKLFERLHKFKKLKKVVYSGAGCAVAEKTFGKAEATEETDLVSLDMDSPYSISKIIGEFYSRYYFKQYHLPVVRARFQNVYGPGEILGAGKWRGTPATVWRNVTPTFIYKALQQEALPLERGGEATRDFIFVEDIVNGLIACALKGTAGDAYNLASGVETSIRELAEKINVATKNPTPAEIKPGRPWDHSGKRFGSTEKAKRDLGFEAKTSLEEGLKKTVAWTEENLSIIEQTMRQHDEQLRELEALKATC